MPTQEQEQRARWDLLLLDLEHRAEQVRQLETYEGSRLYREGAEDGRVMCLSLHPHNIGRPKAAKHLDDALRYILGHDGVWATTADDTAG